MHLHLGHSEVKAELILRLTQKDSKASNFVH